MPDNEITKGELLTMKINWYYTGFRFCEKAKGLGVDEGKLADLQALCSQGIEDCANGLNDATPVSKKEWKELWKGKKSEENELFEMAVAACRSTIEPKNTVAMLKNCYIRLLNDEESAKWETIESTMKLASDNWVSRITPMNKSYADRGRSGGTFSSYNYSGMGSMTPRLTSIPNDPRTEEEEHRITNFWLTELLLLPKRDPMFSGFRSGSLSGKIIGGSNAETNRMNVSQLFEAVVLEEEYRQKKGGGRFVEVPDKKLVLVSINLQTAADIPIVGQESQMVKDQNVALEFCAEAISGDIPVAHDDVLHKLKEVKEKGYTIEALSFNCEVNNIGGLTPWKNNNPEAAWDSIFKWSKAYSKLLEGNDHDSTPFRIAAITALLAKFKETSMKDLLRPANDYKIASRLAALAYLSGCHVHFNCKSGKDRTGLMDIEVKRLVASMYESFKTSKKGEVTVPKYSLSSNDAEKGIYRTLLKESGNFEVQVKNTGGRGFKVAQLPALSPSDRKLASRFGKGGLEGAQGLKDHMDIDDLGKKAAKKKLIDVDKIGKKLLGKKD